ncbi:FIP1[V]-like protein [Zea mays]|nr:FIP1[V]-like protein [Zea mays]
MQSRIRVYESGRSEQDYDPDLPPELAAVTGHPDISADNRNKMDNGHTDFSAQGRGPANVRTPVMTGRPIQVETNYTDRFPSIDSRSHRMRESYSVIEIVCQGRDSMDDETVDQTEKDSQRGYKGVHDVEEGKPYPTDKINNSGHNSNLVIKTEHKRQPPVSPECDMLSTDVNAPSPPSYKTRGSPREARSLKGSSLSQNSIREIESSNDIIPHQISSERRHDSRNENLVEGDSEGSLAANDNTTDKLSTEDHFDGGGGDDDDATLVGSVEVDGDDATLDPNMPSDANEDDDLVHSDKKQKHIAGVEQPTGHNGSEPVELRTNENSKGMSGSSKDQQKRLELGEEVLQDRQSRRVNNARRHHDAEEHNLRRKDEYSRDVKSDLERSHLPSRGREDIHQSYVNRDRVDMRGRSYDKVRETEILPRRDDGVHSRRAKEEDLRLEYNVEGGARHRNKMRPIDRNDRDEDLSRKRLDDGEWRGSRQRERGDVVLNRRESLDDSHIKRNKDDENLRRLKPENEDMVMAHGHRARDDNNRRKKERGDEIDQKRRDDSGRLQGKVDDRYHAKQKDDNWRQRERDNRQRPKHENVLTLPKEEGRGTGRGSRMMDDKLVSGGRKKGEPRSSVLSKDTRERTRQNESSRRGQGVEENNMQNKGRSDVHPRDDSLNSERNSRQEKQNNNRLSGSSDARHAGRDRHRESTRKGRGSELGEHDLHRSSKRRREDHESHHSGKVETKEVNEQDSSRGHATLSKKSQNPQPDNSLVNQVEEDASDDENHEDSRKGRSKLERWTSHKEIEYSNIDDDNTETFPTIKADVEADEVGKSEVSAAVGNSDINSNVDTGQTSDKSDRHLDTVERLKRRSERFKLPMPGEKDTPQSKKVDTEVQPPQNESTAADMEVKPERPARKRRWTGS